MEDLKSLVLKGNFKTIQEKKTFELRMIILHSAPLVMFW